MPFGYITAYLDKRDAKKFLEEIDALLSRSQKLFQDNSNFFPLEQSSDFASRHNRLHIQSVALWVEFGERGNKTIFFSRKLEKDEFYATGDTLKQSCKTYQSDVLSASRQAQLVTEAVSGAQGVRSLLGPQSGAITLSIPMQTSAIDGQGGSDDAPHIATLARIPRAALPSQQAHLAQFPDDSYYEAYVRIYRDRFDFALDSTLHNDSNRVPDAGRSLNELSQLTTSVMGSDSASLETFPAASGDSLGVSIIQSFMSALTMSVPTQSPGLMM